MFDHLGVQGACPCPRFFPKKAIKKDVTPFLFKVIEIDKTKGSALEQIKRKKCSGKYQQKGKKIYLVGIEFSRDDKNIKNFMWVEG
ncbi:MAG: PD-(D/E)XK nuclease domain-containing protein [Deltaproteobacteria bacterium]|nr:PD-(D/E)XK nuclease domain-containing protein [Deltaproteobacteria bacterium]